MRPFAPEVIHRRQVQESRKENFFGLDPLASSRPSNFGGECIRIRGTKGNGWTLIPGSAFDVVDDDDFNWAFSRCKFQAELVLKRGEDRGAVGI